jgi:hypothetical protein
MLAADRVPNAEIARGGLEWPDNRDELAAASSGKRHRRVVLSGPVGTPLWSAPHFSGRLSLCYFMLRAARSGIRCGPRADPVVVSDRPCGEPVLLACFSRMPAPNPRVVPLNPYSRATWAIARDPSTTILAASSLNSGKYFCCFCCDDSSPFSKRSAVRKREARL